MFMGMPVFVVVLMCAYLCKCVGGGVCVYGYTCGCSCVYVCLFM